MVKAFAWKYTGCGHEETYPVDGVALGMEPGQEVYSPDIRNSCRLTRLLRSNIIGCLVLASIVTPFSAFAGATGQEKAVDQFLRELIVEQQTPGLQYLFVDADKVLFEFHGGSADLNRKLPVRKSTTFNGYSITKTFTAAAILTLAQEGNIGLDKPISQYLTDLPYQHSPTIRQTLQHMGGFPNPNPLSWVHLAKEHASFDEQAFVRQVVHDNPGLDFSPGEKVAYSNVGYLLLGEVVHRVSGRTYIDYVQDQIIKPLSLSNDDHIAFTINDPANHARGYIRRWYWLNLLLGWFLDRNKFMGQAVDGWVPFSHILTNGNAYGGLVGNAGGFATYLQAMLAVRPPFNREMLDLMWKTGTTNDGKPTRRGLAWLHGKYEGLSYFSHTGGGGGYYCEMRIYPDANRASVIMTNNTGISNQHYLDRIDRFFLAGMEKHGSGKQTQQGIE